MIILHTAGLYTGFANLFATRYWNNILNYAKKRNAKFIEILKFQGLDAVNEDIIILDMTVGFNDEECFAQIKIINKYKLNKYNFKLYCTGGDIWPRKDYSLRLFMQPIVLAYNYKVLSQSLDVDNLCNLWENNSIPISKYKDNFICFQYNYYYDGIIVEFNDKPLNRVSLSGNCLQENYPERYYLKSLNLPNVDVLDFIQVTNYTKQLSNYVCSFVSNAAAFDFKNNKYVPVKFLLLKYLEVLASGSLLLTDDVMQKELENIGIKHGENCYVSSMNNIKQSIDYITHSDNREEIDRIRLNGYVFYKDYKLQMDNKIEELFKDII
jgi:hypothetical protein